MSVVRTETLVASAASTATAQSTGVDMHGQNFGVSIQHKAKRAAFYLATTAKTGTAPTLAVTIQDSPDNVTWTNVIAFTTVSDTAVANERKQIEGPFQRYVRASWVIGGSDTPGQTFSVAAVFED
jgi:hypothetical protein